MLLKVVIYDLKLEMSVYEVIEELLVRLDSDKYDMIILNFVNLDMVGYIGVVEVVVKVIEFVDECLGNVVNKVLEKDGCVFIIVDYGNVEIMIDFLIGNLYIVYIIELVLFVWVLNDVEGKKLKDGKFVDIVLIMLG